jgi:hypothetical protein
MTWSQTYLLLGFGLGVSGILSATPIFTLLILLGILRKPAWLAGLCGLGVTFKLSVASGGHFRRPSTGGDSFTTMNWLAIPGEAPEFDDYLETLTIVPDVKSFADAVSSIDFTAEAYTLKVEDSEMR